MPYFRPDVPVLRRQSTDRHTLLLPRKCNNALDLSFQFGGGKFSPVLGDKRYLKELVLPDENDMIMLRGIKLVCGIDGLDRVSTCVESGYRIQRSSYGVGERNSQPLVGVHRKRRTLHLLGF